MNRENSEKKSDEKDKRRLKWCYTCGTEVYTDAILCRRCRGELVSVDDVKDFITDKDPNVKRKGDVLGKRAAPHGYVRIRRAESSVSKVSYIVFSVVVIAAFVIYMVFFRSYSLSDFRGSTVDLPSSVKNGGFTSGFGADSSDLTVYFSGSDKGYLGCGIIPGPDPEGVLRWAVALGDLPLGPVVCSSGVVYAAVADKADNQGVAGSSLTTSSVAKVIAIEAALGEQLWELMLPEAGAVRSAELLLDGSYIYAIFNIRSWGMEIFKIDHSSDGRLIWNCPIIVQGVEPLSAVVVDDVLVLATTSDAGGKYKLGGYAARRGQVLWGFGVDGRVSPPVALNGGFVVVEADIESGAHLSLRTLKGAEVFRKSIGLSAPHGKPVIAADRVLVAGPWSFGRFKVECYKTGDLNSDPLWDWDAWLPEIDLPPAGFVVSKGWCAFIGPGGHLVILDMEDGNELACDGLTGYEFVTPPVSNGDLIFSVTADGTVCAVRLSDAVVMWTVALPEGLKPLRGKPIAYHNGRLYCLCKNGVLVAIE